MIIIKRLLRPSMGFEPRRSLCVIVGGVQTRSLLKLFYNESFLSDMAGRRYFLIHFNYVEPQMLATILVQSTYSSNWPFRDYLGDTIASYIDYCEVPQKTGSRLVHQNNATDTTPPISHVQPRNSQS